jgi:hypothetical protein
MTVCSYCRRRKGKRSCPALGGFICAVCCATHRGRAIRCPTDCVYFLPGEAYQQERSGQLLWRARQPVYDALARSGGERGVVLLNLIDFACYGYAAGSSDRMANVTDQELLAGMEEIRATLSPLTVAAAAPTACGQHLWGVAETWLKQQPGDRELMRSVLDQAIAFGRTLAGRELAGRKFIQGLVGMIDERFPEQAGALREKPAAESRLILPAASTPRAAARRAKTGS